ncbi:uncharacterized protein LOC129595392 [Paramacrobiotus metropolitanus]|uniref:uncharacterized protein LOC129595392 n=1 Tax=Paramacrobiotus metropolitanus TaxID=2943436 RepID=UPI002445D615|nr:uncharacterized protein LOC129595392 [Paramacrobiotus metropolitanus]
MGHKSATKAPSRTIPQLLESFKDEVNKHARPTSAQLKGIVDELVPFLSRLVDHNIEQHNRILDLEREIYQLKKLKAPVNATAGPGTVPATVNLASQPHGLQKRHVPHSNPQNVTPKQIPKTYALIVSADKEKSDGNGSHHIAVDEIEKKLPQCIPDASARFNMEQVRRTQNDNIVIRFREERDRDAAKAELEKHKDTLGFTYIPVALEDVIRDSSSKTSVDQTLITNYRPIAILHPVSKIFEKCIANYLRCFLESNCLLSDSQFGFRAKRNTELQCLVFSKFVKDFIENGVEVDAVMLDCSKAFDRVDHQSLLTTLGLLGVDPDVISLLDDYLTGREQIVVVNGVFSKSGVTTSGVPQGSVLGPILFICEINGIVFVLLNGSRIFIFADDVFLCRPIRTSDDCTKFQEDIDAVFKSAVEKRLTFNPKKSVHMRFSNKRSLSDVNKYFLNNVEIESRPVVKYLGLVVDRKLRWGEHTSNLCIKIRKRIGYILSLFNHYDSAALICLYKALIFPLFDYCSPVVKPFLKTHRDDLDKCALKFLKRLRMGNARTDYSGRLREINWDCVELRRIKTSLCVAYKLVFGMIPFGSHFFICYESVTAVDTVAGNTRNADRMSRHPFPIQAARTSFVERKCQPAKILSHGGLLNFGTTSI